jgi:hypothetical protein
MSRTGASHAGPGTSRTLHHRRAISAQGLAESGKVVSYKVGIPAPISRLWEEALGIPIVNTLLLTGHRIEQKIAPPVFAY